METTRINGYLYPVKGNSSSESDSETNEKELDVREQLAANGVSPVEILRMISDSE